MKLFSKTIGFFILAVILFYIYARLIEPALLVVQYENISSDLLGESDSIRLIQFSDTHISEFFDRDNLQKIADKINQEKPHLVVFTGDLIEQFNEYEDKDKVYEIWEVLSHIEAPLGKYAVYGNHDYGGGAQRVYQEIMEKSGFKLLINERVTLEEYNINIIGMDDSIFGSLDQDLISGYLEEDCFNIILSHEPDVAEYFLEDNLDLFLTGHSHGGQINLPFISYTPPLAQKYIRGLYQIGNSRQTKVYVNVGLGTSQIPMRFMAPPELTVITLNNK